MKAYFSGCETVADVKSLYRRLALQHHPDRGGNTATMQEINAQYEMALAALNGELTTDEQGRTHTYYYDEAHERAIMEKLAETLQANLPGCEIMLIGKWLWVVGETKPVRDTLKGLGYQFHGKRTAWYWKPYYYGGRYHARAGFDDLAATYGARVFTGRGERTDERESARAALM